MRSIYLGLFWTNFKHIKFPAVKLSVYDMLLSFIQFVLHFIVNALVEYSGHISLLIQHPSQTHSSCSARNAMLAPGQVLKLTDMEHN